ncbi:hypothetical protein E2562_032841 [Oryza meyeriana var. granulata]|uniref:BHLH domain-containing protein n=2 Tax=Oryza meyeriana var. granulata TaxID=110450 RepID=A0A6G1DQZ2_9ORYZ|nr:hypothetical protein E2562_032841 [Oryza meyeriana var. granulata]
MPLELPAAAGVTRPGGGGGRWGARGGRGGSGPSGDGGHGRDGGDWPGGWADGRRGGGATVGRRPTVGRRGGGATGEPGREGGGATGETGREGGATARRWGDGRRGGGAMDEFGRRDGGACGLWAVAEFLAVPVRLVKQVRELRRLVPCGREPCGLGELFQNAASHIEDLQVQVKLMRMLLEKLSEE